MDTKLILLSALFIGAIVGLFSGIGLFIAGIVKANVINDGTQISKQKRRKGLIMTSVGGVLLFVSYVIIQELSNPKSATSKMYGLNKPIASNRG